MILCDPNKQLNIKKPHIVYLVTLLDTTININRIKHHAYMYLGVKTSAWIFDNRIFTTRNKVNPAEYFTSSATNLPSLLKSGKKRIIKLLAECNTWQQARELEISLLTYYKEKTPYWPRFINQSCGEGTFGVPSDKTKKHLSKLWKNRFKNPEVVRKRSEMMKKLWKDPKYKEKRVKLMQDRYKNPKERKLQSDRLLRYYRKQRRKLMILGFCGSKGVGKTTIANILPFYLGQDFINLSFAGRLKETIATLFGVSLEYLDEHKNDKNTPNYKLNYRQVLQQFGTDFVRDKISETFWVDVVNNTIAKDTNKNYTIDDVRFNNEVAILKDLGAVIFRIDRPGYKSDGHVSERKIESKLVDFVIVNDGSIKDLYNKVRVSLGEKKYVL